MGPSRNEKEKTISQEALLEILDRQVGTLKISVDHKMSADHGAIFRKALRYATQGVQDLRIKIASVIESLDGPVRDQVQLAKLCTEVREAVTEFKGNRNINVKVISQKAETLLKEAQLEIEGRYSLPVRSPRKPSHELRPHPQPIDPPVAKEDFSSNPSQVSRELLMIRGVLLKKFTDLLSNLNRLKVYDLTLEAMESEERLSSLIPKIEGLIPTLEAQSDSAVALSQSLPPADAFPFLPPVIQQAFHSSVSECLSLFDMHDSIVTEMSDIEAQLATYRQSLEAAQSGFPMVESFKSGLTEFFSYEDLVLIFPKESDLVSQFSENHRQAADTLAECDRHMAILKASLSQFSDSERGIQCQGAIPLIRDFDQGVLSENPSQD